MFSRVHLSSATSLLSRNLPAASCPHLAKLLAPHHLNKVVMGAEPLGQGRRKISNEGLISKEELKPGHLFAQLNSYVGMAIYWVTESGWMHRAYLSQKLYYEKKVVIESMPCNLHLPNTTTEMTIEEFHQLIENYLMEPTSSLPMDQDDSSFSGFQKYLELIPIVCKVTRAAQEKLTLLGHSYAHRTLYHKLLGFEKVNEAHKGLGLRDFDKRHAGCETPNFTATSKKKRFAVGGYNLSPDSLNVTVLGIRTSLLIGSNQPLRDTSSEEMFNPQTGTGIPLIKISETFLHEHLLRTNEKDKESATIEASVAPVINSWPRFHRAIIERKMTFERNNGPGIICLNPERIVTKLATLNERARHILQPQTMGDLESWFDCPEAGVCCPVKKLDPQESAGPHRIEFSIDYKKDDWKVTSQAFQ